MASKKKDTNLTLDIYQLLKGYPGVPGDASALITRAAFVAHELDRSEMSDNERNALTHRLQCALAVLNAANTDPDRRACVRYWVYKYHGDEDPGHATEWCARMISMEAPGLRTKLKDQAVRAALLTALTASRSRKGLGRTAVAPFTPAFKRLLILLDIGWGDVNRAAPNRHYRLDRHRRVARSPRE